MLEQRGAPFLCHLPFVPGKIRLLIYLLPVPGGFMRFRGVACVVLCTAVTMTVLARQAPGTMDSPKEKDGFEKVHDGMLGTKPAPGTDASRLTQAVARTLPLTKEAF